MKNVVILFIMILLKTEFNVLNSNVIGLEAKIPDTYSLIYKRKYDTDKRNYEKKIEDVDKKIVEISELFKITDYYIKITEVNTYGVVKKTDCRAKVIKIEDKIPHVTDFDAKLRNINQKMVSKKQNK